MKSDNIINYIIHQPKDTKILRLDGLGIDVLPTFSIFLKHVEELHIENNNFVYLPPFPPYSLPLHSKSLILNIENTGITLGLFRGTNEVLYDLSLSTRRDIFLYR